MELDQIILGDCLNSLANPTLFPDNSVDCCITSPPYYKQRDYHGIGIGNENDFNAYCQNLLQMFEHCLRIVKPTGTIVLNIGDKYCNGSLMLAPYRVAIALLSEFPEVRLINQVMWAKRNPTPRQDDTKLISSHEPFFIFAKSKECYFNKSAFMPDDNPPLKAGDRVGLGYHTQIDEATELSDEEKQHAHDDLNAAIQEIRDGIITGLRMKIRGRHALAYGGQEGGRNRQIVNNGYTIIRLKDERIKRDIIVVDDIEDIIVIESNVETIKGNKHPAVFPVKVVEQLIRLLTPKGGVILDPFSGSGTTAFAAQRVERHYIGVEIDPEYHAYSVQRLNSPFKFTASDI